MSQSPMRILITGAAGQIGYSLVPMVCEGAVSNGSPIILHLLDVTFCQDGLDAVVMEVQDSAYPLVHGIVATTDVKTAFTGVDVALLVGAFPRKQGMERKELLDRNKNIFCEQGKAINDYASRNCKVLVVGNPANTNALITMNNAPSIPKSNFTALTRLDHNRAIAMLAGRLNVPVDRIRNACIWGNHSSTLFPDWSYAELIDSNGQISSVATAVNDCEWLSSTFVPAVQKRGAAIIEKRKASSAMSAARAICDHMRDWLYGTKDKSLIVSMGIPSTGDYDTPSNGDLIFSYPVRCSGGGVYEVVKGLSLTDFQRQRLKITEAELKEEKAAAGL